MSDSNPLQKYFRQPSIYMRLPSGGKYYPADVLDMPENGELPVFPMTAFDEITYRTADALFNGSAVVNVIQSCVPAIKDAWQVPAMDIDTILVSIRIASYGHEMEFESVCPACGDENNYALDLRMVMENIGHPDYTKTVQTGDVEIVFKPLSYKQANSNSMKQFEDQKLIEMLPESDLPDEEKLQLIKDAYLKLTEYTIQGIADSIQHIRAGDNIVTDKHHIAEFVRNADRKIFEKIREVIVQQKADSEIKPVSITCNKCEHTYESPLTLDASNFFV